jgi:hypothetical protein
MKLLPLVYLIACTNPAYGVDCGRAITQFAFKAEDLKTLITQADSVITLIQASPNAPPARATIDWLIPFAQSIEATRSLLTIYKLAPECFNLSTRDIELGLAERERILNTIAGIVRGNLRGLRPQ